MINFYKKFINEDDLCFDVGANIGERTEIFLKLGARTVSIEPQAGCIEILEKKFGRNKNLKIIQAAAGSIEKEDELLLCDENSECSTLSRDFISAYAGLSGFHWQGVEKIKVTTLEKLFRQYGIPKFCKIDVEGFESEVFKGMKKPARYIAFEFNKLLLGDTLKSLDILKSIGNSRCNFIKYEIMNLVLDKWIPIREFRENLSSFINPDIWTGEILVDFYDQQ
ncbi:MAG TPA: FkbM family methyltransferase [Ignavibacteriaceae bacterium]|nr:FkbM family methyltransferase [Ignavibacteriaceae bacterium]